MTIDAWLEGTTTDAERRSLRALQPLLRGLAQATQALRDADFNDSPATEPRKLEPVSPSCGAWTYQISTNPSKKTVLAARPQ